MVQNMFKRSESEFEFEFESESESESESGFGFGFTSTRVAQLSQRASFATDVSGAVNVMFRVVSVTILVKHNTNVPTCRLTVLVFQIGIFLSHKNECSILLFSEMS